MGDKKSNLRKGGLEFHFLLRGGGGITPISYGHLHCLLFCRQALLLMYVQDELQLETSMFFNSLMVN